MRAAPDGSYWGNTLLNNPNVVGRAGQWMCVEHMVKLNNPVTAANGEHGPNPSPAVRLHQFPRGRAFRVLLLVQDVK